MRRTGLWICLAGVALMAPPPTAAADASVEVTLRAVPQRVEVGETFSLEVRASVKGGGLESLNLEDLKKYPELAVVSHQTSRPMQVSFGFGSGMKVESSLSHVYAIRALAPGTYRFSPAVARVDGKKYQSEELTIVVTQGDASPAAPSPDAPPAAEDGEELTGALRDRTAFLRTVVEPEEAYIGQQVNVLVYLYTRVGVANRSVSPTKPTMDGFWVYDDPITEMEARLVTVDGLRYRTFLLQRAAAFPQRSGELTIGAPNVTFDTGSMSLFDPPDRIERTGVPVSVDVLPVPPPGPTNTFVGRVEITASLDRRSVTTGNAVTLHVEAGGTGNVQDLRVQLPPIPGVRALQPVIKDQRTLVGDALGGIRTWEWILIPEAPGEHVVPPIALPYFDPTTRLYGSATSDALSFTAKGVAVPTPPTIAPNERPTQPQSVTFGPLRMYSALLRETPPLRRRVWFPWALGLPPLLFGLLTIVVGFRRRRFRRQDTPGAILRGIVRDAKEALEREDPRAFYDGIVAILMHALVARTDESIRGMSNAERTDRLTDAGFDADLIHRITNELEGADFARFAASGVDTEEMTRCLERTETILERIRRVEASP
ncbi:MAG: BatD family protein [Polyangiales bacterium]